MIYNTPRSKQWIENLLKHHPIILKIPVFVETWSPDMACTVPFDFPILKARSLEVPDVHKH